VNITSYCDVTNSVYTVTITTIRHCSILDFGWGVSNQAVAPGITRHRTPLYYSKVRDDIDRFVSCQHTQNAIDDMK